MIIDLSHPLDASTPPWPGNPPTSILTLDAIPAGHSTGGSGTAGESGHVNVTCITTCNHTGTHMDAPAHFRGNGRTIDRIPLDQVIGRCTFLRLPPCPPNAELEEHVFLPIEESLRQTRKLVVDTGWARFWNDPDRYFAAYPTLGADAARWLIDRGMELFGFDSPSVDRLPHATHHVLLEAGAVIVENLANLNALPDRDFELIVTPLPLAGLEASPVRAVARS